MKFPIRVILVVFILLLYMSLDAQEFQMIVNSNLTENTITSVTIRNIFLGKKKKWNSGDRIILVTLDKNEIHEAFLKKYIRKSPHAFLNFWRQKLFTGKGVPPISFEDEEEVLNYVATTKGAIGYVSHKLKNENVKTLKIIE